MKNSKVELLAPAGSPEKMKYAFLYGADAVYMGIPDFSLRVRINKFGLEDVKQAIELAHKQGKKIYVTLNIYAHNTHLENLPDYLKKLNEWKPDALIISDPGILELAKEYAPELDYHLSTQANATNWRAVKFWAGQGVSRVILGREVTLQEIKEIKKHVPEVELEYFVHGAMCMSYSGRCMLSSWLTRRSANLGDCVQPCRWGYNCKAELEIPKHEDKMEVYEDRHGTYIFNSKDLCLIEYLSELIDAGVCSLKIEGRAKSVGYIASVVKAYRQAIDAVCENSASSKEIKQIKEKYLDTLMSRGYTTGFLFGQDKEIQDDTASHVGSNEQLVGEVLDCQVVGDQFKIIIRPHNALRVSDKLRIISPVSDDLHLTVSELYNEDGTLLDSAHGGANYNCYLLLDQKIESGSIIFVSN